jgi:hypothetical protein
MMPAASSQGTHDMRIPEDEGEIGCSNAANMRQSIPPDTKAIGGCLQMNSKSASKPITSPPINF